MWWWPELCWVETRQNQGEIQSLSFQFRYGNSPHKITQITQKYPPLLVDVIQTRCSSFGNAQVEAVEQPPGWVLLYPDSLSSGSPPTLGTVTWRVCLTGSAVLFTSPLLKCLQRQHIPKSSLIRWTWCRALLFFGFHTAQLCCRSNGLQ